MAAPILFVGSRTARILQVGVGYVDGTAVYNLSARSNRIAPAGPDGECIFTALTIATRHYTSNATFWITPYVDSVALNTQQIALTGAAITTGIRQTRRLGLLQPYTRSAVEISRYAPRGTWFELLIETQYVSSIAAKQIIELIALEWEPVRSAQLTEAR